MNYELLDLVSDISNTRSSEVTGSTFIKFSQRVGANVVHVFMGTALDNFRVTTLPEWAVEVDCSVANLLSAHNVQSVRAGAPRTFWGAELLENRDLKDADLQIARNRYEHFGSLTNVTFAMPDTDGVYRGGGVGLGFEDKSEAFRQRMDECCGALAVASFAAHSQLSKLSNDKRTKSPLSKRQSEILKLLAAGYQLAAISDRLCIADSTVNMHIFQLKKKLNTKTKEQALAMALSNGWIEI